MKNLFKTFGIVLTILIYLSCKKTPGPPVLSTASVSAITSTSAVSGGNVTDDGGVPVTSRGVCWNTTDNPLITDNKTSDSEGPGSFTSNLTSLIPNTNYFVRAYATNSKGTSYGSTVSFQTSGAKPSITTSNASHITTSSASLSGIVNPNSMTTTVTFEYGLTTNYGNIKTAIQGPVNGSTLTDVSAELTGLSPETTYHYRINATNEIGTSSSYDFTFTTYSVVDADNNLYHSVTIGTQIWMAENLKTTRYSDGTSIPFLSDNTAWAATVTGAYCDYNNTPENSTTYGRIYNWYVVDNNAATKTASNGGKNVCPTGWHAPADADWTTLVAYLGGENVAGGKLRETGTTHWTSSNGASNESGFTALPAGSRFGSGGFTGLGVSANFWSSTPYPSYNNGVVWYTLGGGYKISIGNIQKKTGYSVRCIRDF
jgi:uncharacterized protein (TIGR02145 family)